MRGALRECCCCGQVKHSAARAMCEACYQDWRRHPERAADEAAAALALYFATGWEAPRPKVYRDDIADHFWLRDRLSLALRMAS